MGEAQRVGTLTAAVVSFIVAVLALMGASAAVNPNTFQEIAILAGAWFFMLVFIITPYRMWLAQRAHIAALDATIRTSIEAPAQQAQLRRERLQAAAKGYQQLLERADELRNRPIFATTHPGSTRRRSRQRAAVRPPIHRKYAPSIGIASCYVPHPKWRHDVFRCSPLFGRRRLRRKLSINGRDVGGKCAIIRHCRLAIGDFRAK